MRLEVRGIQLVEPLHSGPLMTLRCVQTALFNCHIKMLCCLRHMALGLSGLLLCCTSLITIASVSPCTFSFAIFMSSLLLLLVLLVSISLLSNSPFFTAPQMYRWLPVWTDLRHPIYCVPCQEKIYGFKLWCSFKAHFNSSLWQEQSKSLECFRTELFTVVELLPGFPAKLSTFEHALAATMRGLFSCSRPLFLFSTWALCLIMQTALS